MSAIAPARSRSTVRSTRSFSVTTCRTRRRSSSSPSCVQRGRQVVDRRCRAASATPRMSAACSQDARRRPYSPSASECATLVSIDQHGEAVAPPGRTGCSRRCPALVSNSSTEPGCGGRRRGLVHRPARHPDEVVLGLLGEPGDLQRRRVRRRTRPTAASVVTHSTAADEDRPAPDGTWESRARSNPPIGWPASRSAQIGAEQVARPGLRGRRIRVDVRPAQRCHRAGPLRRDHPDDVVVVAAGGQVGPGVDGERQHQAAGVVGVLADQVDPAGRGEHARPGPRK